MSSALAAAEAFTPEEASALAPYFGNTDLPVFVLTNLPEAVKGALFARYSRSAKSARRLFLDEFLGEQGGAGAGAATATAAEAGAVQGRLPLPRPETGPGQGRAQRLYSRILAEYGDDSVAQLGGAHLACEGISNVATKIVERGRLMAYLEQSTRYVPLTARPGGEWPYVVPAEVGDPGLRTRFVETLDRAFATYARWIEPLQAYYRERHPREAGVSEGVYRSVIRAKALDALRGLLPAATRSNVGVYGSGQAYEALLLRMQAHELAESRELAGLMLAELRKVIPAFLERVDREDRGGRWRDYLRRRNADSRRLAAALAGRMADPAGADAPAPAPDGVVLTDFDPEGEVKVVAAALYPASGLSYDRLLAAARAMTVEERIRVLRASAGARENRRHRPGRAFEHATYAFDVLTDYGAFRDLQRHRMLTIDWQDLTVRHGSVRPGDIDAVGARADWDRAMADSANLHERVSRACSPLVAQYAVSMAYRTRFHLRMNAREAMHVLELRTTPQGHPAYRRVCQRMHRLIAEGAGHTAIADAMTFVDHGEVALERLDAERRSERRRETAGGG